MSEDNPSEDKPLVCKPSEGAPTDGILSAGEHELWAVINMSLGLNWAFSHCGPTQWEITTSCGKQRHAKHWRINDDVAI